MATLSTPFTRLLLACFFLLCFAPTPLSEHLFEFGIIYSGDTGDLLLSEPFPFRFAYSYLAGGGATSSVGDLILLRVGNMNQQRELTGTFVLTFYRLLELGRDPSPCSSHWGDEPATVKCVLENPTLMRTYFEDWLGFVQFLHEAKLQFPEMNIILHSEPDSWGFMCWAFGVEGEDDPRNIAVAVASSGMPGLESFENNALGLSQALIYLRNQHGSDIPVAFHSSNFRVGTRPEVMYEFILTLHSDPQYVWDMLFVDDGHWKYDEGAGNWWEPWEADEPGVVANLNWYTEVTTRTGLNLTLWQAGPGPLDFNLLHNWPANRHWLVTLIEANIVRICWHFADATGGIRNYRFHETPPPGHEVAGGTAGDVIDRVEAYNRRPVDIDIILAPPISAILGTSLGIGITAIAVVLVVIITVLSISFCSCCAGKGSEKS